LPVTIRHLVGTRENVDIVYLAHFLDDWLSANTNGITPSMECESLLPNQSPDQDFATDSNLIRISVEGRERQDFGKEEDEPNGDASHIWRTIAVIDVWAESKANLGLFEDELNRIIWEMRPNAGTRLLKSDGNDPPAVGTDSSEIEFFENTEIRFERFFPGEDTDQLPTSQGRLTAVWFKLKT